MKMCLVFISVFLFVVCLFSGCSSYVDAWNDGVEQYESIAVEESIYQAECVKHYFEKVGEDDYYNFVFYRHLQTDVMYFTFVSSSGYGRGASLSVLYAADGSPLLYSEWIELRFPEEG